MTNEEKTILFDAVYDAEEKLLGVIRKTPTNLPFTSLTFTMQERIARAACVALYDLVEQYGLTSSYDDWVCPPMDREEETPCQGKE